MLVELLAQKPPPTAPQPLPEPVQGLLSNWVSIALAFMAVTAFVFFVLALAELASARQHGTDPPQTVDRILTLGAIVCIASSIGAAVSLIYTPT